tara:strand:+ start:348 stop:449 length:102 start_codon:yes stop_codon:yes gene_type:complete
MIVVPYIQKNDVKIDKSYISREKVKITFDKLGN